VGIRFRDNRKVDPETLQPRLPDSQVRAAPSAPGAPAPEPAAAVPLPDDERVAELTADLQRLSAEYANYRKRVERDREVNRDRAVAAIVAELMPILDDIDRARGHGELDGGFKAVSDALEAVATKFGMERFGETGEPFDPHVHEAMTSQASPDVTEPTVSAVYLVGYRLKDQVLRPARVAVADIE
jgi:molecular chaperone GrpE